MCNRDNGRLGADSPDQLWAVAIGTVVECGPIILTTACVHGSSIHTYQHLCKRGREQWGWIGVLHAAQTSATFSSPHSLSSLLTGIGMAIICFLVLFFDIQLPNELKGFLFYAQVSNTVQQEYMYTQKNASCRYQLYSFIPRPSRGILTWDGIIHVSMQCIVYREMFMLEKFHVLNFCIEIFSW